MNSMSYRFTLDMHTVQSQISLPVSLGDTARTLYMSFTDGGKPYTIEKGCLAKLTVTRPSGTKLSVYCPIQGNTTAVYDFSQCEDTAAEEGIHDCEITLYGRDERQITSPRFNMVVSGRVVDMDDDNGITGDDLLIIDQISKDEAARQGVEESRVEAEAERVEAENAREVAEGERVEAENARVQADADRTAGYKRIENDTIASISKILREQESIKGIQEALINNGEEQELLSTAIALQNYYIGGGK